MDMKTGKQDLLSIWRENGRMKYARVSSMDDNVSTAASDAARSATLYHGMVVWT